MLGSWVKKRRNVLAVSAWGLACMLVVGLVGCNRPSESETTSGGDQPETVILRPSDAGTPAESEAEDTNVPSSASTDAPASETSGETTLVLPGGLKMKAPEGWESVRPAISMIQYEFRVPAVEGDARDGRATFMAAGGSVDANIQRWIGQFAQPDGSDTAEKAKVSDETIAGTKVHIVELSGTYNESMGPMAPPTPRENYRMLAAIVETSEGLYFIKFYGPDKTVAANRDAFLAMLHSLE
ncbi:MAG: hypothetical protein D6741_01580 [Planctomycetota bacterium]|nr:MAG: hypothetical protein D6741_01580 [Planctomycetota bacterium]